MINVLNKLCFSLLFLTTIASCGGDPKKEGEKQQTADTGTTSPAKSITESKKGMTVSEAKDFLDADEANAGKEITVSAYGWGSNERTDGKIQLNLGDEKMDGMQSASFSCMFDKSQTDAVKAVAKNAMVTVTGKIGKGAGGVELTECKFAE